MNYSKLATSQTPAFIIYLIDVSASMQKMLGDKRRIEVVMDALASVFEQMIFRSTKGMRLSPRYKVALYAYSDKVYDVFEGIKDIDQVAQKGLPELSVINTTETAKAFKQVLKLLEKELPRLRELPAPLVCHLTDGEYTGEDPEPIVKQIMEMSVDDGNVLVENIFISDEFLQEPIRDVKQWRGIKANTTLRTTYANKLKSMSSALPESYWSIINEMGFSIDRDSILLFPGYSIELMELGFQMSAATPVR